MKLGETLLQEENFALQQTHLKNLIQSGVLIPLMVEREKHFQVAQADGNWQIGDRLIYLLHDPKPKLLRLLSGSGQTRLTPEKLAEVEKVALPPKKPEPVLVEEAKEAG